jgi:endonuclease/exonuclease/phosphatase family metal-dependent hydrolase
MTLKKLSRLLFLLILSIFIAGITFFFWASSSNYSEEEYSQLIENNYPAMASSDSVYSIITYNLGYLSGMTNNLPVPKPKELFDTNLTQVYKELESLQADILCFQEIDYHSKRSYFVNQQGEIQKLGYNHVFQAVNWDINYLPFPYFPIKFHFGEMYSGQSILSKYPLSEPERIVLDRVEDTPFYVDAFYLDRLAQVAKVIIDGKTIVLINVHFEAFDDKTRAIHAAYIGHLYGQFKDDYPVLLVGDFNSDINYPNSIIQSMLNLPGIKTIANLSEKTFPSDAPIDRLDYIFYNEKYIEAVSSRVLTSFGDASDHLPVIMEFKFR